MTDTVTTIEKTILRSLIFDESYSRKVLPFIKEEYFQDKSDRIIFSQINDFVTRYNNSPSTEALTIAISNQPKVSSDVIKASLGSLEIFKGNKDESNDAKWLVDSTEAFCKKQAVYNAVLESIHILNAEGSEKENKKSEGAIPGILSDALAVTFDTHVGHDYLDDATTRFDFYHRKEKKLPFDIDMFNKITKGGIIPKTLNIVMGGTGVFKTGTLCHFTTAYLRQGLNVLYITMEMAEEKIAERIDANLLDVTMDDLQALSKDMYEKKISRAKSKTVGKLIIKEYPTASASVSHFRQLMQELLLKLGFKPDVVMIDYLNICASSRLKLTAAVNSYTYVKAIAEEIRGFAQEFNVPVWSATQTNRLGFGSSDPDLTNTSESFGLPATSDLFLIIANPEELEVLGQLMFIQGKNRYNDTSKFKRFVIGVDKSKMRLYDLNANSQKDLVGNSAPTGTQTPTPVTNTPNKFAGFKL